jgi:hypothetical protein
MNMTNPKRGQVCIRVGLVTSKWYQSWEKRDEKQTRIWSKEDNGKMLVEFHIRQHSAYIDGIVFADNRMPLIWYLATSTMLSYFLSWKGTGSHGSYATVFPDSFILVLRPKAIA